MLKKLLQFIRSLFDNPLTTSLEIQRIADQKWESHEDHVKAHLEALQPPPIPKQEYATLNLDTGKIILPDNLTPEEKAEVEAALKELNESLQKFAPEELYKSLEEFLQSGDPHKFEKPQVFPLWEGVTPVNKEEDSLAKVKEEMDFCEESTEHWNDIDFAEALNEFQAQGYKFAGVEQIYHKINAQDELTGEEKKKLREWYKLATQEFVYGV